MIEYLKWLSQKDQILLAIKAIVILMLLYAVTKAPYDYYLVLRWVVCATSIYLIYESIISKKYVWIGIFIVYAIIFNPIKTPQFNREIWLALNILVALGLALSIPKMKAKKGKK